LLNENIIVRIPVLKNIQAPVVGKKWDTEHQEWMVFVKVPRRAFFEDGVTGIAVCGVEVVQGDLEAYLNYTYGDSDDNGNKLIFSFKGFSLWKGQGGYFIRDCSKTDVHPNGDIVLYSKGYDEKSRVSIFEKWEECVNGESEKGEVINDS
jgi:hypothetical protein